MRPRTTGRTTSGGSAPYAHGDRRRYPAWRADADLSAPDTSVSTRLRSRHRRTGGRRQSGDSVTDLHPAGEPRAAPPRSPRPCSTRRPPARRRRPAPRNRSSSPTTCCRASTRSRSNFRDAFAKRRRVHVRRARPAGLARPAHAQRGADARARAAPDLPHQQRLGRVHHLRVEPLLRARRGPDGLARRPDEAGADRRRRQPGRRRCSRSSPASPAARSSSSGSSAPPASPRRTASRCTSRSWPTTTRSASGPACRRR